MDCTHLIERLEAFEERMGVRLEALFASRSESSYLTVRGELHPKEGTTIQQDIELVADVYDSSGRLVAHNNEQFDAEIFFGFQTFEMLISLDVPDLAISKVRLYPKPC